MMITSSDLTEHIDLKVPSYLMECSTASNRGRLMAFYSQFLTTGNVLACGINYGTNKYSDSRSWRKFFVKTCRLYGNLTKF